MNEWINTELNWWTVEIEEEKTLKLFARDTRTSLIEAINWVSANIFIT